MTMTNLVGRIGTVYTLAPDSDTSGRLVWKQFTLPKHLGAR